MEKCPTIAGGGGGGWAQLELTDALGFGVKKNYFGFEDFYHSSELLLSKNIHNFCPGVGFRVYKQRSRE